jgi:Tfp pilus assembly protein PilE
LIELLIVVVVIGILASIAIPQFARVKERSFNSAAKSDLRNLMTAEEAYFSEYQAYLTVTVSAGGAASITGTNDFRASQGVALGATAASDGFAATAKHASSSETWCVNTSPGATTPGKILKASSC